MKKFVAIVILFIFPVLHTAHANLLIVHARMWPEEDPLLQSRDKMMARFSIYYNVLDVGRGVLTTLQPTPFSPEFTTYPSSVSVSLYWRTVTNPLPRNAILILNHDARYQNDGEYNVLGLEANRGILPYDPEIWNNILFKSDSEIIGEPLPPELALANAEKNAMEKGAIQKNIYLLNPRGDSSLDWAVNVFYLLPPYLYQYTIRLNNRGEILHETMPLINRFYQPGEDLEAFMSREYAADSRGVPFRLQNHLATSSDTTP